MHCSRTSKLSLKLNHSNCLALNFVAGPKSALASVEPFSNFDTVHLISGFVLSFGVPKFMFFSKNSLLLIAGKHAKVPTTIKKSRDKNF
jgi:hypothetical protein